MKQTSSPLFEGIPRWIITGGISSILIAAIIAAGFGVLWLFNYAAPISVPLLLAIVIGVIAYPLVKIGDRLRFPRPLSSFIVILLVLVVLWGSVQITIMGVVGESRNIGNQLIRSVNSINRQFNQSLTGIGLSQEQITDATININKTIRSTFDPSAVGSTPDLLSTVANGIGSITGAVTSVMSALFGFLIASVILFYVLSDYERIEQWWGTHLGVEPELGVGLVEDATSSLRDYFKGMTIKNIITALGSGLALLAFGVPLVLPVTIVTFIAGYIPFFGAWIAIAFAVLIAFGTKGVTVAIIVLVLCVVVQNIIEPFVNARVIGDQLDMHPIVVLGVTILGSTLGGLLGATLAAPLAGMVIRVNARLKATREKAAEV
jgi:predicted PurR-regulated permease PerM